MDRNIVNTNEAILCAKSLSARRAWIEIPAWAALGLGRAVALRKESVDRNDVAMSGAEEFMRRSPQGERG